ncbi:MAG: DUF4339 domain-containing protein [Pyrinomonadaceae bacterium]
MKLYVYRNGEQLGPFEQSRVLEMITSGALSANDLGVRPGELEWQKLSAMFPAAKFASSQPETAPIAGTQSAPPAVSTEKPKKKLSVFRLAIGLVTPLVFVLFFVCGYLMSNAYRVKGAPTPFFWGAFLCLALCAFLVIGLAAGIGGKRGMSYWRTPILCLFIAVSSLGIGSVIHSKLDEPNREENIRIIKENFDRLGLQEGDEIYDIFMRGIERDDRMMKLNGSLMIFGVLSLILIGVSFLSAMIRNSKFSNKARISEPNK